ncbi:sigma-70 family RNA polymerase sigma factor [Amycolatopsis pigmentata]|uniref:Sigma-70 family RNA polymerase sigma factor n=1 Tax=Amycolatopsis pigmentata TaxID=450801 RepID=A0ABW5FJT7_9PSEU
MDEDLLARRFEAHRPHLRSVAYRMLGSSGEAEDAVQETWLRLSRADTSEVANLAGWLTTVIARVCLDLLRARKARREDPMGGQMPEMAPEAGDGPEEDALRAESVSRALLVVLDRLEPAERVAFVLHDLFAVPFATIAPLVERTPAAAKKLASRARQRVRGRPVAAERELARHRQVVEAFLTAAHGGDLDALLAVLDPDVVRRADPAALRPGAAAVLRGARVVAGETVLLAARTRYAEPALVNGAPGLVVAPGGRLRFALVVAVSNGKVTAYEVIADPARLERLELAVLGT